jgi:outer membrane protein assembly factor BamD
MSRRATSLKLLTAVVLAAGLTACAGSGRAKEEKQFVEQPVEQLYNRAANLLDSRRWSEAAAAFEEVERQHPYSSWARRSMLMIAYANYEANKYDEAIQNAQRFISLHPGNESAPYAYYLIAVSQFEHQKTTELALGSLQEVVRRYPGSEYARDARVKMDMTYDQLAGKEMEVGRFYLSRDQHLAAINRFRSVIDDPNYQRTSHTPEALHRLVEGYLSVGMTDEAQRAAAVLGYNFPGSPWYSRSFALMTGKGVPVVGEGEARKRGWLGRAFGRL